MNTGRTTASRAATRPLVRLSALVALLAASLTGCAARTSGTASSSAVTTSTLTAPTSPPVSTSAAVCPNVEGGACLGSLTPGTTYGTVQLSPQTRYSVTEPGWFNYEDTPGNFLLVPPGSDLAGVNAGTSDFIGVYTSVAPSTFVDPPSCRAGLVPGVAASPDAVVAWMQKQPAITVTAPVSARVGGLSGLVADVTVKPGAQLPVCKEGGDTVSVALLFSGRYPSSLDHGVIADMTMRLYLLAYQDGVLAIELDDIAAAPVTMAGLDSAVQRFRFTP